MNPQPADVLLVEDNADHVELILGALQSEGAPLRIYVATDGKEGLDFLHQRGTYVDAPRPKLVLLDIKLPKVHGLEVLRRIKLDPNLKSIPVVMLTTSANEKEIAESYRCGANSYIVKPVGFAQFVKVIKDLELYWLIVSRLPQ